MTKIHISNRIRPEAYSALKRGIEIYGSQTAALENLLLLGAAALNGRSASVAHNLPTDGGHAHCEQAIKSLRLRIEHIEKRCHLYEKTHLKRR